MKNVLLLGGAGFIGSNLAETFIKNSFNVIIYDREDGNFNNLTTVKKNIKIYKGELNDVAKIESVFKENNIEYVIHLIDAFVPGTRHDYFIKEIDKNLSGTLKIIDIMHLHGVHKLIYFSSGGLTYGRNGNNINSENDAINPITYGGWFKIAMEKYIQTCHYLFGLDYLILRPSNPFGKYQNFKNKQGFITACFNNIKNNLPVEVWGDGSVIRDYIFIDDLCDAVFKLIEKDQWNEIYNIGSNTGTSLKQLIDIIRAATKTEFDICNLSSRKTDIPVNILDISKIKSRIGWNIQTDIKEGIEKYWKWFVVNG